VSPICRVILLVLSLSYRSCAPGVCVWAQGAFALFVTLLRRGLRPVRSAGPP
jgi:hypothetical protein